MFDLSHIAVDPILSAEGRWKEFGGGEFLIARWNNRKATAMRNELHAEFYSSIKEGMKPEELQEKFAQVQAKVMAECILLGWKNVGDQGSPLKYSPETALKILVDPRYVDLYDFVTRESIDHGNYSAANVEAIAKDVKPSADS